MLIASSIRHSHRRIRRMRIALLALALSFTLAFDAAAAILARGLVTRADGKPIQDAEVALNGAWTNVRTGPDGRFAFPSLKPGRVLVGIRHENFATLEQSFDVASGDTPSWTFVLDERGPEPLPDRPRARELLFTDVHGAFKQPLEQRELPQSVTVVTRDGMRDRAAFDVRDAARGVAGVIALPDDGRGALDFVFRGMSSVQPSATLRDGDREPAGVPRDLASIERLEFLRGPGAALEGASGARGGSISTIAKRPRLEPFHELSVAADAGGHSRTMVDHGATFGTSRATYRVNAALGHRIGARDATRDGLSLALAPVFDVPLGELTHLLVRGEYVHRTFEDDPGLPLATGSFGVPRDRFVGEPDQDVVAEGGGAQAELTHYLEGDIQLRQSFRYLAGSTRGRRVHLTGLTPGGLVTRDSRATDVREQAFSSQSELLAQIRSGRIEHSLVTGVELSSGASERHETIDDLAAISLTAPVHGATPIDQGIRRNGRRPDRTLALFAQDHMRLNTRLRLLLSTRTEWHEIEQQRSGIVIAETRVNGTTPRAGLVFQPTQRGRAFASISRSFRPGTGCIECGDTPVITNERGTQVEVGWKQEYASGRFAWTASGYTLTQRDVRSARPLDVLGRTWRIGGQRSRGVEFNAAGMLGNDLRITAGYAYTDARVIDPGDATVNRGARLPMTPFHHTTAWAVYRVPAGPLAGLDLGAGLVSMSARASALGNNTPELPAFHEVDLMLGYGRRLWQAQIEVRNVNDARAYDAMPGERLVSREPRGARGLVSVRF